MKNDFYHFYFLLIFFISISFFSVSAQSNTTSFNETTSYPLATSTAFDITVTTWTPTTSTQQVPPQHSFFSKSRSHSNTTTFSEDDSEPIIPSRTQTNTKQINRDPSDDFSRFSTSLDTFVKVSSTVSIALFLVSGTSPPVIHASVRNLLFLRSEKCASFLITNDDDQRVSPRRDIEIIFPLHPTQISFSTTDPAVTSFSNAGSTIVRTLSGSEVKSLNQNTAVQRDGISTIISNCIGLVIGDTFFLLCAISGVLFLVARVISMRSSKLSFLQVLENIRFGRFVFLIFALVFSPCISAATAVFILNSRGSIPTLTRDPVSTIKVSIGGLEMFLLILSIIFLAVPLIVTIVVCVIAQRTLKLVYDSKRDYADKKRKRQEEIQRQIDDERENNQLNSVMLLVEDDNGKNDDDADGTYDENGNLLDANERETRLREKRRKQIKRESGLMKTTFTEKFFSKVKHWSAYLCVASDGNDWDFERDPLVRRVGVVFEHSNSPRSVIVENLCFLCVSISLGFMFSRVWRPFSDNDVSSSTKSGADSIVFNDARRRQTFTQPDDEIYFTSLLTCQVSGALATCAEFLPIAYWVWRRPILKRIDLFTMVGFCCLNVIFSTLNTAKFYQFSSTIQKARDNIDNTRSYRTAVYLRDKVLPVLAVICQLIIFSFSLIYFIFALHRFRDARKMAKKKKQREEELKRLQLFGAETGAEILNLRLLMEEFDGDDEEKELTMINGNSKNLLIQQQQRKFKNLPSLNEALEELLIEASVSNKKFSNSSSSKNCPSAAASATNSPETKTKKSMLQALNETSRDEFDFEHLETWYNYQDEDRQKGLKKFKRDSRRFTTEQIKCIRLIQHYDPTQLFKMPRQFQEYKTNTALLFKTLCLQYCGKSEPPEYVNVEVPDLSVEPDDDDDDDDDEDGTRKKRRKNQHREKRKKFVIVEEEFEIEVTDDDDEEEPVVPGKRIKFSTEKKFKKLKKVKRKKIVFEPSSEDDDDVGDQDDESDDNDKANDDDDDDDATEKKNKKVPNENIVRRVCQEKVREIFEKYDPTQIPTIADLLKRFKGKELDLLYKLEMRYGTGAISVEDQSSEKKNKKRRVDEDVPLLPSTISRVSNMTELKRRALVLLQEHEKQHGKKVTFVDEEK